VRTSQGNELAAVAGGHGQLRASDADREQAVDLLKDAFVQGQLTSAELDVRAGQALAAKTYAQLAALTADIGAASTAAEDPPKPARTRPSASKASKAGKSATAAVIAACVAAVTVLAAAGAHLRPGPDAVACQSFSVWLQQANVGANTVMLLDFSVAAANQGPSRPLARDVQALRQAVLQYENPAGPLPSASVSYADRSQLDAAIARVNAACAPYSN
jgi:Domain of unknown function (DUF1707)